MNKKGNILDNPEAIGWFFMIVIVLFIMWIVMDGFQTAITGNNETNITSLVDGFEDHTDRLLSGWDYGVIFLAILLPIFSFIAARKIPTDTTTMIITFLVLGFILIFSFIFSNVYGAMMDNATFSSFSSNLVFIPYLFRWLPYYSIIYIFIVMVGLFTKQEGSL